MANNRMWLRCEVCGEDLAGSFAKYYPTISNGWFVNVAGGSPASSDAEQAEALLDRVQGIDAFLAKHSYCDTDGVPSLYGNRRIVLAYEEPQSAT